MKKRTSVTLNFCLLSFFLLSFLSGCAYLSGSEDETAPPSTATASQPYYAKDFREILIPDGLEVDRENSMFVKTSSLNGGILNYQGRLEVNSLTEFFENSMQKNNWTLAGAVKSDKSLLIFTKPNKTCMITISDSDFNLNTEVYIYITEENTIAGNVNK